MKQMKFFLAAAAAAGAGWLAGPARADSVWVGEEGHPPIQTTDVKITSVDGDKLAYTLESGVSKDVPFKNVQQISVDGETSFNAAEAAFATDKDKALAGYQASLSSGKDWIKARSASRLIVLAKAKNKFDVQEAAFVQLVKSDAAAAAIPGNMPNKPSANTPGLDAALSTLSTGVGSSGLSPAQKAALLNQQLEIYRAKGDASNVSSTLSKLSDLGATTPAEQAMLVLAKANVDCDNKDYTKALALIQQNSGLFNEVDGQASESQVEALYVLARAADGQAGSIADLNKTAKSEPEKLKSVAVAYMRAETFGEKLKDDADKSHVAMSLLRTAEIKAALGDKQTATALFQQILDDKRLSKYPAAAKAKTEIEQLKGAA